MSSLFDSMANVLNIALTFCDDIASGEVPIVRVDDVRQQIRDALSRYDAARAGGGGDAEIDDDTFEYGDGMMLQCISGFGRNATTEILERINDAIVAGFDNPANVESVSGLIEYCINEFVRWCRHFNGELQKEKRAAASREAELEELRAAALVLSNIIAGRMRWEPFSIGPKTQGELCFGGIRYSTELDESGCPRLPAILRAALTPAEPKT